MTQPSGQRLDPKAAHEEIRRRHPEALLKSDYLIFSDGSGCEDPYGGAVAFVVAMKSPQFVGYAARATYASYVHNNVERVEFEAFLSGLQLILDRTGCHSRIMLERQRHRPPTVAWVTDRESLALSVWRPEDKDPFYGREASPDLWARFSYYEPLFRFVPLFFKRGTIASHTLTDHMSSDMRLLIKEWATIKIQDEQPPYIPPQ